MARSSMRAARRLNWGPLGWMALGALIAALAILGPRVALNRGLDAGYSLAGWVSSLV
jgi:hypothetical protein